MCARPWRLPIAAMSSRTAMSCSPAPARRSAATSGCVRPISACEQGGTTMIEETLRTLHIGPAPRLAVDVMGGGPLLLFLHGIGGNRSNWSDQLPAFAPHFTAVAWDARGY